MAKAITFKRSYSHPVEKVWKALTDKQAMSQWLMETDIEAKEGFEFTFKTKPSWGFDGIVRCRVLEVIENEKLSFTWCNDKMETVVSFLLHKDGENTILNFEQSGFQGIFENLFVKKILANGWRRKILNIYLPEYLAK